jgi:ferric-dicitrate binding protein FerR (iron transport regulator)
MTNAQDPSGRKNFIRDFLRGKSSAAGDAFFNNWWNRKPDPAVTGTLSEDEKRRMAGRVFLKLKDNLSGNTAKIIELDRSVRRRTGLIAAAVLILVAAGTYLLTLPAKREWLTITTVKGERRKIVLADGTMITLNERSKLRYPKVTTNSREVGLEGEAFFQVARDPAHPFIVTSGHTQTKVLGTSFNIQTDQVDSSVVIAMEDGRVSLTDDRNSTAAIYLKKGDVGVCNTEGKLTLEDAPENNLNYFSWMNNSGLNFDETSLSRVIIQLRRIYGIRIVLDEPTLNDRKITLQYPKTEAETILHVIGKAMKAKVTFTNNTYHIK